MKTRLTPETDAAWACFEGYMEPLQDVQDLSRKLERERDEARAESIRWQSIAEGRGRTDDNEQCHTCGSTSTIDNGSACAQCGCDKSLTPNAKP
jgi:hypothetical protein